MRTAPLLAVLATAACSGDADPIPLASPSGGWSDNDVTRILRMRHDPSVRADPSNAVADDPDAAHLGRWLFFNPDLSRDGTISCASCHHPDHGFADPVPLSTALGQVARHTPSIWNTANNEWFFWDGRSDTHWSQALKPLEDAAEHGGNRVALIRTLANDPDAAQAWQGVFGPLPDLSDADRFPDASPLAPAGSEQAAAWDSMGEEDRFVVDQAFSELGKAIAAYERSLMTGPTLFDAFADALAEEDPDADALLTPEERRGLQLFVGPANCHLCHFGPDLSNEAFHNIGLDGSADNGRFNGVLRVTADPFNAAGAYSDDPAWGARRLDRLPSNPPAPETLGQFKVPSLRGVGQTPPYFHDGSHAALEDVIRYYSRDLTEPLAGHREESLVVLDLSDADEAALVAFLRTLDVPPLPAELLEPPARPYR